MADPALNTAQARLANAKTEILDLQKSLERLQARLKGLEDEKNKLTWFIATWHEMAGIQAPAMEEPAENVPVSASRKRPKNPDREHVADVAREIIRERGHPVSRKDLFDALAARGLSIEGKDPEMVLSTMLWRTKDKIVRLPNFGYWLTDEDYTPAEYVQVFGIEIGPNVTAAEPEDGVEADDAD
jgi:hypothetical protein